MDYQNMSVKAIKEHIETLTSDQFLEEGEILKEDERKSVQALGNKLIKAFHQEVKETMRLLKMSEYENKLFENGCQYVAGIDEVGRGPLAGPVVAACVVLPQGTEIKGINDSKKLSQKLRESIFDEIKEKAEYIGIGIINNKRIDQINILNATKEAMVQALEKIELPIDHILIDAVTLEDTLISQTNIIKGDEKSISIAAASIIAKVTRDAMMTEYHDVYPCYDFDNNKGYGTQKHHEGIHEFGISPIHRKSFLKNII